MVHSAGSTSLHYLGHLCNTTTLKVGEAQGKLLEERAKQINARFTGSRFLRSLLVAGGLRRDLQPEKWVGEALEALRAEIAQYVEQLEASESHLDRLITTGVLTGRVAFDQGATGPVQRASGADRDLRRDHPYAAYADVPLTIPVRHVPRRMHLSGRTSAHPPTSVAVPTRRGCPAPPAPRVARHGGRSGKPVSKRSDTSVPIRALLRFPGGTAGS